MGHARIDCQGNGKPICCCFFSQPLAFRQEKFIGARLDQHGWQAGQIGIDGGETGIFTIQFAFVFSFLHRNVQGRTFA